MSGTPPRPLLLPALALALLWALAAPGIALPAAPPVVAVVDTGVDLTHPALRAQAWSNPDEVAGNGLDDDGNGFVDDVRGADFVDGDGTPADPRGHGTHIAGLIARRGRGRRLGRPTGARIMAVRVLGPDGRGRTENLVRGIEYAIDEGARVINLSLAYFRADPALLAALERAAAADVLVVAAAGNDTEDLDSTAVYPASFRTPTMIVVAASFGGRLESWSARGARSVDLAAPGTDLRSALPGRRYGRMSGTSQATAVVSRAAVRVWRSRPAATALEVRGAMLAGARRSSSLAGAVLSGGRLDLRGALAALPG